MDFLNQTLWGISVSTWLAALGIFVLSVVVLQILKRVVVKRIAALAARTANDVDDLIAGLLGGTKFLFILVLSLYFATQALTLPENVAKVSGLVTILVTLVQVGYWGNAVINYVVAREVGEKVEEQDTGSATAMNAIGFIGKVVLWSLLLLLALDNAGVEITSLVASLGIGGVAVALAVQNILSDLFAALSIVIDQPIAIGDFIVVDDLMGTVERIGLKTTRVRSLFGEELVFSNSDLLNSRIRNYKSLGRRRVTFSIGITYGTPYNKVSEVPRMIETIIEAQKDATYDRAHFKEYGDFALVYEIVYYVEDPDYNVYMDIQQAINLSIYQHFEKEGIEFAFPTQTIFLEK